MTVLDTFYILFKTNADEVKRGMDTVNKVAKETEEKLKNTNEQAKTLGDTFVKMVEGGAELAGMASAFNLIKAGVVSQRDYNAQLYTTGTLYKQNVGHLKSFAQAAAQMGGSREGAMSEMIGMAQIAQRSGGSLKYDPWVEMKAARARYQSLPENARGGMLTGPHAYFQDPGMQMMLQMNNKDFNALMNNTGVQAAGALSSDQAKNAFESRGAKEELQGSVGELTTAIAGGGGLTKAITGLTEIMSRVVGVMGASSWTAIGTALAFIVGKGALSGGVGAGLAKTILRGGVTAAAGEAGVTGATIAGGVGAAGAALASGAAIAGVGAASLYAGYKAADLIEPIATWWLERDIKKLPPSKRTLSGSLQGSKDDMGFWMSQGYSKEGAAGWVANMMRESSGDATKHHMDTDGKMHYGLFQWSPERRAAIKAKFGIDVATASKADQLRAAALEAGGMGINRGMTGLGAYDSGAYVSSHFEKPGNGAHEAMLRGQAALSLAASYRSPVTVGNANITISAININAPGSDAKQIAQHVKAETRKALSTIQAQVDNGRAG